MTHPSNIRLLEVVQSLEKGGRTNRFIDTVICLQKSGVSVTPMSFSPPASWVKLPNLIELNKKPGIDWKLIFKLKALLKINNINLIHAHCECSQLYVGIAGKLLGIPVIGTFHRSDLSFYNKSIINTFLTYILSAFITVSNDRQTLLIQNLKIDAKHCHVVHGGTSINDLPNNIDKIKCCNELQVPSNKIILLSIGHLGAIKGHQDTITAIANSKILRESTLLYIAGDGSEHEKRVLIHQVKKLGLEQQVILLGQVNNVYKWLTICDVFVQPSLEEAFGLVFIEAGAFAKPVVATNIGGIKEIIQSEETGILVPPNSPKDLADAITRFVRSKNLREQMGMNNFERISSCFTVECMRKKYLKVFTNLLS